MDEIEARMMSLENKKKGEIFISLTFLSFFLVYNKQT